MNATRDMNVEVPVGLGAYGKRLLVTTGVFSACRDWIVVSGARANFHRENTVSVALHSRVAG
jgi:hypothetical protein